MLDMEWRRRQPPADWNQVLNAEGLDCDSPASRGCTYAGRPFGNEGFVSEMAQRFRSPLDPRKSQDGAGVGPPG
jgi:hypothetical protein